MLLTKKTLRLLSSCPLFEGMDDGAIKAAVESLDGYGKTYGKGEYLHRFGEPLTAFGLVLSGSVKVCSDDLDGNTMIMAEVRPGITFGESLCFLRVPDSPVYIYASEDTSVLWMKTDKLFSGSDTGLQRRFAVLLAHRTLSMNERIQILSKISIREKLCLYFASLARNCGSREFTLTMNREDLAAYIGANRSAMSRELSRMKKDGIIDCDGKKVKLLKNADF